MRLLINFIIIYVVYEIIRKLKNKDMKQDETFSFWKGGYSSYEKRAEASQLEASN